MKKTVKLIVSVIICEAAGVIGSIFTTPAISGWYTYLEKPGFNPPNWVFAPAWATLFLLMGISLYLVWDKKWKVEVPEEDLAEKSWNPISTKLWIGSWREANVIIIFSLQLVLNILWSVIFFGLGEPGIAFFEILMLWFAILYTIVNFHKISRAAAYLLLPYLAWVSFASVLSFFVWTLNQ